MKEELWSEFREQAILFGHDPERLEQEGEVSSNRTIHGVDEVLSIASVASAEQKKKRSGSFFTPALQKRQRLGQGAHDRAECYLFAGGSLSEQERKRLVNIPFQMTSVLEKRVLKNQCWDVTASFPGNPVTIYNLFNVGRLILEEGASVIVRGNIFRFLCQELIIQGKEAVPPNRYHFGILPRIANLSSIPQPLYIPPGNNGTDGLTHYIRSTILGPVLDQKITCADLSGRDGQAGDSGIDGRNGRNGDMCYLAEIAIRKPDSPLIVYTQTGSGENGEDGTAGGNGGGGGNGTKGCKHLTGIVASGHGGNGGNGGHGGAGGHGGHGGISSNIYINVPEDSEQYVTSFSPPSIGGRPGKGGPGGSGGQGGYGGEGFEYSSPGISGKDGRAGKNGRNGQPGKNRESATIFLNEKLI